MLSQCVLSREPDFVQSCFLTIFKTLQWLTSLTKQTQNSLASHVRFWYQYKNCFPIFISNHKSLTLWAHWITLHFPNVLSTTFHSAIFEPLFVSFLQWGMEFPPSSLPVNILPWPSLECYHGSWSVCWSLRIWEICHLDKFWVFDFLCCWLATRVHFLTCQQDSLDSIFLF